VSDGQRYETGTDLHLPPGQAYRLEKARTFHLLREEDVSGVSGVGVVAWGVAFPDGKVVTRWRSRSAQTACWDSIEDVEAVHGHGGATTIVWDDEMGDDLLDLDDEDD